MTSLTEAGRKHAILLAAEGSIVANVALFGSEGGWPPQFQEASIKEMNALAEERIDEITEALESGELDADLT